MLLLLVAVFVVDVVVVVHLRWRIVPIPRVNSIIVGCHHYGVLVLVRGLLSVYCGCCVFIDMTIYILDIYVFIFMSVLFYITYVNDVNA